MIRIKLQDPVSRAARASIAEVLRNLLPEVKEVHVTENVTDDGYEFVGDIRKVDCEVALELAGLEPV